MPKLSPMRAAVPLVEGLGEPIHRGKVRDTYDIGSGMLLVVATDGVSIFDIVMNAVIPYKGPVLMAMTHFWMRKFAEEGLPTHFVAAGDSIDMYLPRAARGNIWAQSRSMVVHRLDMCSGEFINRSHYLSSSTSFKGYSIVNGGEICGHILPPGLQDGDALPGIIDTPTTKADEGHDLPRDAAATRARYPEETALVSRAFDIASAHADSCGIIMPDGKGEVGRSRRGILMLGDEYGTPDSSRFWDKQLWTELQRGSPRKSPPPYDKQFVRAWGIEHGVNKLNPENADDVARAHALTIPDELIDETTRLYREICRRITGQTLVQYLENELGVTLQ